MRIKFLAKENNGTSLTGMMETVLITILKFRGCLKYTALCVVLTVLIFYKVIDNSLLYQNDLPQNIAVETSLNKKFQLKTKRFYVDKYILLENAIALKGHFTEPRSPGDTILQLEGLTNFMNLVKPTILNDKKLQGVIRRNDDHFHDKRIVTDVDCRALISGSENELYYADKNETDWYETKIPIEPEEYMKMTKNCSTFIKHRGYIMHHLTLEEENFPLAFSILMYRDVEQAERLLRAIYRPQNIYCIHVDSKSSEAIYNAMSNISDCFGNVFTTKTRLDMKWGHLSILTAELLCMKELWQRNKAWKYFINLTGQEFPLRTNYELVRILKAYNGANDVNAVSDRGSKHRWTWAGPPPFNITPVKGAVHVAVQRGFVDYVLHDSRATDILNWVKKTFVPDETFFSTLNHNPVLNVPGSYRGFPRSTPWYNKRKPFIARFKNWETGSEPCMGKYVRHICVFGIKDLPFLSSRSEMFANKFILDYEPHALDCMEELHYNKSRDQYRGTLGFDASWYSELDFVKNKVN